MKIQNMKISKLVLTIVFTSTFAMLGCQKQDAVQAPDATENAAQAAQAAQAATDAAYAAAPAADDPASLAIETANNAAVATAVVTIAASKS